MEQPGCARQAHNLKAAGSNPASASRYSRIRLKVLKKMMNITVNTRQAIQPTGTPVDAAAPVTAPQGTDNRVAGEQA